VSGVRLPSICRRILHSLRAWPRDTPGTLDLLPDGFEYTRRGKTVRIQWHDITQIDAGMRDYLTVDLFFAVIHTKSAKVTIDELVDGFRQLELGLFEHWPRLRDRWTALQASAPHEPQYETLWQR
jgi:hypothetical protein